MPTLEDRLQELYEAWCKANGIELTDAESLLARKYEQRRLELCGDPIPHTPITDEQEAWLQAFSTFWDQCEEEDSRQAIALRAPGPPEEYEGTAE